MTALQFLDYLGVALFAATGALTASRKQLDIIGFSFLAAITGVGGDTVRDIILGVPVFWVEHEEFLIVCLVTALLVYVSANRIESRYRLLLWLDAVALAAYSVLGAHKGMIVTDSAVVAVVMGTFTGTLGGILRDVIAREPSVLLRQEIYIGAAMAGASVFVIASLFSTSTLLPGIAAAMTALIIRGGALYFGWTFPSYQSRPGRDPQ